MKRIIGIILVSLFFAVVSASAQTDYCFKNEGLKGATTISFTLKGNKITEGEFEFVQYESTASGEINHFTGTKTGSILTIKFDRTIPEDFSRIKKIVWTLGKKSLQVPTYGKNYNTNKYSIYTATYEKCKEI